MITSKYVKLLGFLLCCMAFIFTVSEASAATPANTTIMNQGVNHTTTTKLNTLTSGINTSKPTNSTHKIINDPQIYKNGVAVSRGGHPAGYVFPSIGAAISSAINGDTIMLENGATFNETNLTITKNLAFNVFQNGQAIINAQKIKDKHSL